MEYGDNTTLVELNNFIWNMALYNCLNELRNPFKPRKNIFFINFSRS